MPKTVAGVFRDYNEAEAVLQELGSQGFRREDISLIAADRTGGGGAVSTAEEADAASKAGTGAAVGGMAGLVLGLAALAIPGIGPIVAAGPLAAALTGAGVGAAAGGVIGALSQIGVSDEQARSYADLIANGGTVIAVRADDERAERAKAILDRHGAEVMHDQAASRPGGRWYPNDPHSSARTYGDEGGVSDWGHTELTSARREYEANWSSRHSYEDFDRAYRFGRSLGASGRYGSVAWTEVEADARGEWDRTRPGTWEEFKDVVRLGWDNLRGQR